MAYLFKEFSKNVKLSKISVLCVKNTFVNV
jgi:hypothetical protein